MAEADTLQAGLIDDFLSEARNQVLRLSLGKGFPESEATHAVSLALVHATARWLAENDKEPTDG